MTVREHANLAYHLLVDGKDESARADIDMMLAPPENQDVFRAKKDRAAQQQLANMGLMPLPPPPRKKA